MGWGTRLSRWTMYFGVLAVLGTLVNGKVLSASFALLLVLQYVGLQFYRGYTESSKATAGA